MTATYAAFSYSIHACRTVNVCPAVPVPVSLVPAVPRFAVSLPSPFREIHNRTPSGDTDAIADDAAEVRPCLRDCREYPNQTREEHEENPHDVLPVNEDTSGNCAPRRDPCRASTGFHPDMSRCIAGPDLALSHTLPVAERVSDARGGSPLTRSPDVPLTRGWRGTSCACRPP